MRITKARLEALYNNNPNKVVCEKLKITNPTLMSYLRMFNIKTKGSGNRAKRSKVTIID